MSAYLKKYINPKDLKLKKVVRLDATFRDITIIDDLIVKIFNTLKGTHNKESKVFYNCLSARMNGLFNLHLYGSQIYSHLAIVNRYTGKPITKPTPMINVLFEVNGTKLLENIVYRLILISHFNDFWQGFINNLTDHIEFERQRKVLRYEYLIGLVIQDMIRHDIGLKHSILFSKIPGIKVK